MDGFPTDDMELTHILVVSDLDVYDWGAEIRCFFRDPDGHLFEISEIP